MEATTLQTAEQELIQTAEVVDLEAESRALEDAKMKIPTDEGLARVRVLITEQLTVEKEIEYLTERIQKKTDRLREIAMKLLPDLFAELDIKSFELGDGSEVNIKPRYYGSISVANSVAAFDWLRRYGAGDMIKNEVKIEFAKGDDALAKKFFKDLQRRKQVPCYTQKTFVHPQTLGAFIREQVEAGHRLKLPDELLGVHIEKVAQIDTPKPKPQKRRS